MKSYIVVLLSLFAALSANAQTLDVSYQQKHTTVQVLELPHTDVSAKGHDGVAHNFACVPMKAVLAAVQTPAGENLRGAGMSLVVIAAAKGKDAHEPRCPASAVAIVKASAHSAVG